MKRPIETWKSEFILNNYEEKTAEQLAVRTGLSVMKVKLFCQEQRIELITAPKKHSTFYLQKSGYVKKKIVVVREQKFQRPPAEYGNMKSPFGIATSLQSESAS